MDNSKNLTLDQLKIVVAKYGYDLAFIRAILAVESSGIGFSRLAPYRIIIRFEPTWFKREYHEWQNHDTTWMHTGTQNQTDEWKAFNVAFAEAPNAAMLSTSIGMGQLMGFHYDELDFKTVGAFWDYCKISEANQVDCMLKWCSNTPRIDRAIKGLNAASFAFNYNGEAYKEIALRNHEIPYDVRINANRVKFLKLQENGK